MITEPAGTAHYYIHNKSTIDFNVSYISFGSAIDSLTTIPVDSSIKFFEDGSFGNNPSPSTSFEELLFYKLSADSTKLILTINPVVDDRWTILGRKGFEDSFYGLTEYELVISDDDFK